MTRDTVPMHTPAILAISWMVILFMVPLGGWISDARTYFESESQKPLPIRQHKSMPHSSLLQYFRFEQSPPGFDWQPFNPVVLAFRLAFLRRMISFSVIYHPWSEKRKSVKKTLAYP